VQIELRGSEPASRLRQLLVLGSVTRPTAAPIGIKVSPSHQLYFDAIQADAFALFQAVAAQVFNDEFGNGVQQQSGTLRHQVSVCEYVS
jgi:hypothetical protein